MKLLAPAFCGLLTLLSTPLPDLATQSTPSPAGVVEIDVDPRRAIQIERSVRLGPIAGDGELAAPLETVEREQIALEGSTVEHPVAHGHRRAVAELTGLAARAATLPRGGLADPITYSGPRARAMVAGLLGLTLDRIDQDAWIELAPRKCGRRVTFRLAAGLERAPGRVRSGRLELRGRLLLDPADRALYLIESEGRLAERDDPAGRSPLPPGDHRIGFTLRGLRTPPIEAAAR